MTIRASYRLTNIPRPQRRDRPPSSIPRAPKTRDLQARKPCASRSGNGSPGKEAFHLLESGRLEPSAIGHPTRRYESIARQGAPTVKGYSHPSISKSGTLKIGFETSLPPCKSCSNLRPAIPLGPFSTVKRRGNSVQPVVEPLQSYRYVADSQQRRYILPVGSRVDPAVGRLLNSILTFCVDTVSPRTIRLSPPSPFAPPFPFSVAPGYSRCRSETGVCRLYTVRLYWS